MMAALFAAPSMSGLVVLCLFAILIPWILNEHEDRIEEEKER
jgi:hypothetical protein